MIRQTIGAAALLAVALPWGMTTTRADAAGVEVKVFGVSESRTKDFIVSDKARKFGGSFNTTTVTLQLAGKEVEAATHAGYIKITRAVDDKGNDLSPAKSNFSFGGQNSYDELNREHMWFFEDVKPKDRIKVSLMLSQAPRQATKIASLEGTLKLKSATLKDVMVGGLAGQVGKAVADPAIKAAGATVTITKVDTASKQVEMKVTDPNDRIAEYDVVDASGNSLSNGRSSFGFNNTKTVSIDCRSLPANAKLKLSVATSTTETDVPFKLTDIELP
ncbi:MAG: hypothetical protein GC159_10065 [Phycisphaera sp.]|nr:hypothetical protein [Phycisphaera sp.]